MSRVKLLPALGCLLAAAGIAAAASGGEPRLGLPEVPVPADNPQSEEKVALGDRLFHDVRFSSTGDVSCATCHADATAFTDSPRSVSAGIEGKTGTRNAPTVLNSAFNETQFWDGRSADLEDQALHPFVNPVEMGLQTHEPILEVVRGDAKYRKAFKQVFGVGSDEITMDHVTKAIAAFERTVLAGNAPFDRWFFGGDAKAMTDEQIRGYALFIGKARCASCHTIEQTSATFTDHRFHNVGVGVNRIQSDIPELTRAFLEAERSMAQVDVEVLSDARTSELGRFAVSTGFDDIGAFKTPTLRNIELTAPYMHDGSIATLEKVVEHYNNGGVTNPDDPVNDFLAGGIRPLDLTSEEQAAVVAFMRALTSDELASN